MLNKLKSPQQGFTLIEVLVALAILGIIAAVFMYALASSSRSTSLSDERTLAESLARTEMEYEKSFGYVPAPWQKQVTTLPAGYADFSVSVSASLVHATDDGLQLITIVVSHGAKTVYTLTGYKTR
jgi:type II secretion system protein I